MSSIKIRNVHERRLTAGPEMLWDLLMKMPGPRGQLWPPGIPAMRFDGPLTVGAHGQHGPIHYTVTYLDPTTGSLAFEFREPTGPVARHSPHVRLEENAGAVLRHEVIVIPEGWRRLKWPLIIRWVHDAVVEEVLDSAEVATGTVPAQPYERSLWVRALLAVGAKKSRAVCAPRPHHAAPRA